MLFTVFETIAKNGPTDIHPDPKPDHHGGQFGTVFSVKIAINESRNNLAKNQFAYCVATS